MNTRYIAAILCALFSSTGLAGTSENIANLESQLNKCREEYKALVAKTNKEIKDLKAKAPSNLNSIYAEKKNNLKQKANSCKNIKTNLETQKKKLAAEIEFQKKAEQIKLAGPIDKAGPSVRCLRLRQNWEEFEACANSLGLKAKVGVTDSKETAFFAKDITAIVDETNHVKQISIAGPTFWNANSIDNSFIMAFVKQYDVDNFSTEMSIFGTPYHQGTVENGKIIIIPRDGILRGSVTIEYSTAKGGYSF